MDSTPHDSGTKLVVYETERLGHHSCALCFRTHDNREISLRNVSLINQDRDIHRCERQRAMILAINLKLDTRYVTDLSVRDNLRSSKQEAAKKRRVEES